MKLASCLAIAAIVTLVPLASLADSSITFINLDGNINSNSAQTTLSLAGSQLFGVQGMNASFGSGFDCSGSCGTGSTISFTTGVVTNTVNAMNQTIATTLFPLTVPNGTQTTTFGGAGSAFMVNENAGGGLSGFTFSGGFSSESWSCLTGSTCKAATEVVGGKTIKGFIGTWVFQGTVVNGVLTVNGQKYNVPMAGTLDLTTTSGFVANPGTTGPITFTDNTGTTNFVSPVPEPSSLALFGTGLITVGLVTRRMIAGKAASESL